MRSAFVLSGSSSEAILSRTDCKASAALCCSFSPLARCFIAARSSGVNLDPELFDSAMRTFLQARVGPALRSGVSQGCVSRWASRKGDRSASRVYGTDMASPQTLSEAERRVVATWAADCAERVVALFEAEAPADGRP